MTALCRALLLLTVGVACLALQSSPRTRRVPLGPGEFPSDQESSPRTRRGLALQSSPRTRRGLALQSSPRTRRGLALQSSPRTRRGLLELAGVIKCSTGRSALSYMMYGCYCGLGGQGWPRDKADWCCHRHDCCYGDAELAGCQTKTEMYRWTCEDKTAECDALKDKCEKILCKCDREAARCLRKAPFIRKYALWPDFLCGCEHPTCNIY